MNHVTAILGRVSSGIGWLILRLGFAGSGRAFGPLTFWFVWQWITNRYYRLKTVRPGGILKYRIKAHRGALLVLADGTIVKRGDRIVDLHLDNAALAERKWGKEGTARTWRLARVAAADIAALAAPGRLAPDVKALRGLTLLAPAAPRLGFEVRPLPRTLWNNLVRFFMLGLLTIYNPAGRRRLALVERDAYPGEVWLGRKTLIERYGPPESADQVR